MECHDACYGSSQMTRGFFRELNKNEGKVVLGGKEVPHCLACRLYCVCCVVQCLKESWESAAALGTPRQSWGSDCRSPVCLWDFKVRTT